MKNNFKSLMNVYLESINNPIITEEDGVFTKIKDKVMSVFNCFNKVSDMSKNIASGQFDGDCNKLADDGKAALGDVTSSISLLKKPTDKLVNVGSEKVGPLFNGPIDTAKNGGDMNKAVSKMLDETKKSFGSGAQDALKGGTVSEAVMAKVDKKLNLFYESRCFHRKQSHTRLQVERAFRYLIQEHVRHAADPRSFYHNLDKDLIIETSTSKIRVGKNTVGQLIYEEKMNKGFNTKIITENDNALNAFIKKAVGISSNDNHERYAKKLAEKFNLDEKTLNKIINNGRVVNDKDKNVGTSLSNDVLNKMQKGNPDLFKKTFGQFGKDDKEIMKNIKTFRNDSSSRNVTKFLKSKDLLGDTDQAAQAAQAADTAATTPAADTTSSGNISVASDKSDVNISTTANAQTDKNAISLDGSSNIKPGTTISGNDSNTASAAATDSNATADATATTDTSAAADNAGTIDNGPVNIKKASDRAIANRIDKTTGKDATGAERGSLSRNMRAKKLKTTNKLKKFGNKVKTKVKDLGKKIWGFIKKVYRPLYNLLVFIATLIIRLVFAIARFVVKFLVAPILKLFMPKAGDDTIQQTVIRWLNKIGDIKVKFSLTQDITEEINATGPVISKLLKWTSFAGCVGITVWLVANVKVLLSGGSSKSSNNSSGSGESDDYDFED